MIEDHVEAEWRRAFQNCYKGSIGSGGKKGRIGGDG
jgi:hypothetical protein